MPVSPPHGGTTARIVGSSSIAMSSAARASRGPLTCERGVVELADDDSKPRSRRHCTAYVNRPQSSSETPELGEVTPIRSPGRSGAG